MLEQLAVIDGNENFMIKVLANEKISKAETLKAIRIATLSMDIVPILFGCLSKGNGTDMLLDAIMRRESVNELFAGEIGCIVVGEETRKGDTLCDSDSRVILDINLHSHEPLFFKKIQLTHKENRMESIISEQHNHSPYSKIIWDKSRKLLTLYANSMAELNSLVFDTTHKYNIKFSSSTMMIVYHETIGQIAQKEYIHTKTRTSQNRAEFAHVCLKVEPQERGKGYLFVDEVKGGVIPKEFIHPINQAIEESLVDGIEKGYPIVDVKVTLYDGNYHDVDSSYKAFQTAGVEAFKEACRLAKPMLLEPIMKVDIEVDEKYRKAVLLDIVKKGGLAYGNEVTKKRLGDVFVVRLR